MKILLFTLIVFMSTACSMQGTDSKIGAGFAPGLSNGSTGRLNPEYDLVWTPQAANLYGLWHFDGTAPYVYTTYSEVGSVDETAHHRDMFVTFWGSSPIIQKTVLGKFAQSIEMNGDYYLNPAASGSAPNFSVAGWFRTKDLSQSNGLFTINDMDCALASSGAFSCGGSGGGTLSTTFTSALNVWNHYAVTYDGTTLRMYVNGAQVGSGAITIASTLATIWIGRSNGRDYTSLNGNVDELAIWTSLLTPAEISQIYLRQSGN